MPAAPASELATSNLPPSLDWVHFGATTPEQVKAHFTGDNLMVADHMATRGLQPQRTLGPNSGRMVGYMQVVRKTNVDGYIGELGDNYGSISFYFTPLAEGQPPVLHKLEVSQLGTTGNVCQPAQPLAAGAGLEGCDANDRRPPRAPDAATGAFHACIQYEDNRTMMVDCTVTAQSRSVSYEVVVGQGTATPTPTPTPTPPAAPAPAR